MSLANTMTALVEYVGDRLVNECGRPIPSRVLRYHGTLPADCCTDEGDLSVSWADGIASDVFPTGRNASAVPCAQRTIYTLTVRYRVCTPIPPVDSAGVEVSDPLDARYDLFAAMLADTADCIADALIQLSCPVVDPDQYEGAVTDAVQSILFRDATPILPAGGCAGLLWRVYVSPKPAGAVS